MEKTQKGGRGAQTQTIHLNAATIYAAYIEFTQNFVHSQNSYTGDSPHIVSSILQTDNSILIQHTSEPMLKIDGPSYAIMRHYAV